MTLTHVWPPPVGLDELTRMRRTVGYACGAVILARLLYAWQPLRPDEGGYLLVARNWRSGGEFLYGDLHVDRPPLLMVIFRVAALWDWDGAIRLLSIPFAVVAVLALARAGYLVAGAPGARWSAIVAAALMTSPALAADQADGELFAVAFVAAGVTFALEAWRRPAGVDRVVQALAAGALAGTGPLVKQNFFEGLLFVGLFLAADAARCRRITSRCREVAGGAALGALLPALLTIGWARSAGFGPGDLLEELVSFRGDAFAVIWQGNSEAPIRRGVELFLLATVSVIVPLVSTWFHAFREGGGPRGPLQVAVSGGLFFGMISIVSGGSYWPHYLLQLVPMLAIAAAIVSVQESAVGARMRRWSGAAAWSTVATTTVTTAVYAAVPWVWAHERTGQWLSASSQRGDTAVVAYGTPSILESADLSTPYPYLWSLPMRTLDPRQDRLRSTLAGDHAPTWLIEVNGLNSWDIDQSGRLRALVAARYDAVATVCGYTVWLREDLSRVLGAPPEC